MTCAYPRDTAARPVPGGIAPGASGGRALSGYRARTRCGGFTLIELLVVMALMGLLVALVAAGVGQGLRRSRMTTCLSNFRQMGLAVVLFTEENDGQLPGTSHGTSWTRSLAFYLGSNFVGRCPAVPQHRARMTYGWNDCLATNGTGLRVDLCRTPVATMAMAELAPDQSSEHFHFSGVRGGPARVTPNQFKAEVNVEAHGNSAGYLFVDGHAENITWPEIQRRLTQNNSTFLVP